VEALKGISMSLFERIVVWISILFGIYQHKFNKEIDTLVNMLVDGYLREYTASLSTYEITFTHTKSGEVLRVWRENFPYAYAHAISRDSRMRIIDCVRPSKRTMYKLRVLELELERIADNECADMRMCELRHTIERLKSE